MMRKTTTRMMASMPAYLVTGSCRRFMRSQARRPGSRILSANCLQEQEEQGLKAKRELRHEMFLSKCPSLPPGELRQEARLGCMPRGVYGLDCYEPWLKIPLVP